VEGVAPDAMEKLLDYKWPGNVRELENIIERAIVLTEGKVITENDLPHHIRFGAKAESSYGVEVAPFAAEGDGQLLSIKKNAKIMEKALIKKALEKTGGNKTQAAHILEISLPALLYKMKDYGLS
jgi:two-component system response regulator AtoC